MASTQHAIKESKQNACCTRNPNLPLSRTNRVWPHGPKRPHGAGRQPSHNSLGPARHGLRHDVYAQENDCAKLRVPEFVDDAGFVDDEEGLMSDLDLGALLNHAEVPCSSDAAHARQSAMHPRTTYFISTRTCGRSPVGSVKPPSMPKNGT